MKGPGTRTAKDMMMTSRPASRILTALVYAQLILCVAGVASVLLRHGGEAPQMANDSAIEESGPPAVRI